MKLIVSLVLLFSAPPSVAGEAPNSAAGEPAAVREAPELLLLEKELTRKLDEKKEWRVTPEQYLEWKTEFRARLDATLVSPFNQRLEKRSRNFRRRADSVTARSA